MAATRRLLSPRTPTHRDQLGRYDPLSVTENTRWKFRRERRAEYLRRLGAEPDERQTLLIAELIDSEWQRRTLEADAERAEGRERLEYLRLANEAARRVILLDKALAETELAAERAAARAAAAAAREPRDRPSLDERFESLRHSEGSGP